MNYEDRLRAMLQHAGEALPEGPRVDRQATIRKARRDHRVNIAAAGLAAAAALVLGAVAAGNVVGRSELRPPLGPRPAPTSAPRPSPTPTPSPTVSCSATGLSAEPAEQDLPPAVADLRARIVEAAVRCDYRALARLATEGEFTHSFGDSGDPARYWKKLETADTGEEPMAMLVKTLDLPHCVEAAVSAGVTSYNWPAVQCASSTEQDYDELRESGLYTEEELRLFEEAGAFHGWRVGITEEGDWFYFTAGD